MQCNFFVVNSIKWILNVGGNTLILQFGSKNKKATINPKNNDDKCFQYTTIVALNYNELEYNPERVSNILLLISK